MRCTERPAAIAFFGLLAASLVSAQSLRVTSEFQRIDPFGEVVAVDRMEHPREILSPAVARNAYASFHLSVTLRQGIPSFLYVQQNPEVFKVTLYKELYAKHGQSWIPDGLQAVSLPYTIILPEPGSPIADQNTIVFLMDIWVPAEAPVSRVRIQAVLKSGDRWLQYPMEIRVTTAMAPRILSQPGRVPPAQAPADRTVYGPLCGMEGTESAGPLTIRQLIRRNVLQDMALAHSAGAALDKQSWCSAASPAKELGAEWYLRVRDSIYKQAHR